MPRPRSEVGLRIAITIVRSLARVVSWLGIGALRRLGALVGRLLAHGSGRAAHVTRVNVDLVYADKDADWRHKLVRASLEQTAMTLFEAAAMWTWPLPQLANLLKAVEGEELITQRPPGRGVIVLLQHFGNWEYIGYYLNTLETLTPLYQQRRSRAVDDALVRARGRLGSRSVPDNVAGLRRLLTTLREGGLVAILPDQVPADESAVVAPFFGRRALTMSLVSKLLQRVDVDVVVGAATRVAGGFSIRIETVDEAIRDPDAAASARAVNAAVENVVKRNPAQYQWEYKRFRLRDEPDVYKR